LKILVTGGSGFVGNAVVKKMMTDNGITVRTSVRRCQDSTDLINTDIVIAHLSPETNWLEALVDINVVIHAAARVHMMKEKNSDSHEDFRKINVDATINLAKQASEAGVKRFIYLSSIKVNGESTQPGCSFTAEDVPRPLDPYGISKYEAEIGLRKIAEKTGMEVVIIRPPLVYGPGVKANFASMMRVIKHGVPLPLASVIGNKRSLVALDNLVDLIIVCIRHPAAANQTFLVSDDEDVSTAELLRRMGLALKRPAKLFYVPSLLLKFGAALLNKSEMYQRLSESLQVDITKTKYLLNWKPSLSLDQGLRQLIKGEL
jgi:nucleoside-diphosphate-sugar epimerase